MNPAIPAAEKVAILDKLNEKLGMQKELRNLIAVLIDNNRIAQVSEVAAAYRRLLQEQLGIQPGRDCDRARTRARKSAKRWWPKWPSWPAASKSNARPSRLDNASFCGGTVVRIGSDGL